MADQRNMNQNQNQRRGRNNNDRAEREPKEFEEKVVQVSRVSKKTKGGNKMGFSVLMVVGDRQGRVGVGLGKASDVLGAIRKGVRKARKRMFTVPMDGTTIPFPVETKRGAARIIMSPAPKGSGVIAGGPVRAVVEAAGIRDISAKILGSSNKASNVYATFEGLQHIRDIVNLRSIPLKSIADEEREEKEKEREELREAKQKVESEAAEAAKPKRVAKPKAAPKVAKKVESTEAEVAPAAVEAKPKRAPKAKATKKVEAAEAETAEKK